MFRLTIVIITLFILAGCAGVRTTDKTYAAHAENINFLFMRIPGGDTHERAMALIPDGGDIKTIKSNAPWTPVHSSDS